MKRARIILTCRAIVAAIWLNSIALKRRIVLESLTAMKRTGADIIITYHALDAAGWLK